MKLKDKFLRYPLAPEVLALLEKIDSIESIFSSSARTSGASGSLSNLSINFIFSILDVC